MNEIIQSKAFMLGTLLVVPSQNLLALSESASSNTEEHLANLEQTKSTKRVHLQPKVMEVLAYLVYHHKRVVSAQELMEKLWPGRIVTQGSVQKSINAIRTALTEFLGDQEVIVHYSKRGYQFQLTPIYIEKNDPPLEAKEITNFKQHKKIFNIGLFRVISVSVLVLIVIGAFTYYKTHNIHFIKNHKTQFTVTEGYTLETGQERSAVPNPDNQHVAYIKEKLNSDSDRNNIESDIVIRDKEGKDWRLSRGQGSWFKLSWSPSGKQLAAVEVKSQDGPPRRPNFYDKANYLYSFHVFTLDLQKNQILEKQLLSQWQGRIYSLTWWDENTLEIVAKQGVNGNNGRYRYSTLNQQLSQLDDVEATGSPIASSVLNKITALASSRQNGIQIDFLDEQQHSFSHTKFDVSSLDISWIPDGSGVLITSEEEQKLLALYVDASQIQIPFNVAKDKIFSRPKYGPLGDRIYYTEEQRASNIDQLDLSSVKTTITHNANLNYNATYSFSGDKVAYASVRNNQTHLWLIEGGQEKQLTQGAIPKKINSLIWTKNDGGILFSTSNQIFYYQLSDNKTQQLLDEKVKVDPIAYFSDESNLYFIKTLGDVRNLWFKNLKKQQEKQLTFGSVGSALESAGDIYFQYLGENALWVWRHATQKFEQIPIELGASIKLLSIDGQGVYYITGGQCNESDVYYLGFREQKKKIVIARSSNFVLTSSFHSQRGVLQTECYLPEANIVIMK